MKYLIFSDTHLTEKFEPKKLELLKKIITSADRVIIAGDFYDQYFTSLNKVLNSDWKPLLDLLKEKKAVYIPGNHDLLVGDCSEYSFCQKIVPEYEFKSGKVEIVVRHGHKLAPGFEKFKFLPQKIRNFISGIHNLTENILTAIFGWLGANMYVYRYLDLWKTIKIKKKKDTDQWWILGHIHLPYFNEKIRYVNTGFINHGLASYVLIEDGKIKLKKEGY
jgi:predicted phosphodiesterase